MARLSPVYNDSNAKPWAPVQHPWLNRATFVAAVVAIAYVIRKFIHR